MMTLMMKMNPKIIKYIYKMTIRKNKIKETE